MPVNKAEVISTIHDKAGEIYKVTGSLSAAQINASDTTPIEIISAPGAGKVIHIISVICKYTFVSTPYVAVGDLFLSYNGGVDVSVTLLPAATLNGGSSQIEITGTIASLVSIENNNISIFSTGAISGGDSTAKYEVIYKIVDFN